MNLKAAIDGIKSKDETAFEFIYNSTSSSVYGIIMSIIKDRNKAEDIMQETYIKMIRSINSYNDKYNFKSWLLATARNTALDHYRSMVKEDVIDIQESEYLFPTQKSEAEDNHLANCFLSLLDEDEREIVILFAMENFKHKDIAEIVGKPLGTVTWLYNKAMNKLKQASKEVKR
jgi:RNA polymerase sigma-70 factor (ECF subfamily)